MQQPVYQHRLLPGGNGFLCHPGGKLLPAEKPEVIVPAVEQQGLLQAAGTQLQNLHRQILPSPELTQADLGRQIQFLPRLRGLARKPLVLLRDDGRNEKAAVESLSQEDACYLIRQATLEDMLRELRAPAHSPAESLEKRCERIYRSWGLNTSDANKRYLTGAVRVMMASDHRLAIRKEILGAVAQEHHLTIAAVDSALRRLLDTLDATGTQAWLDFRKEYGLERKRVTIGRLIYALESKLSQQEG